MEIVFLAPAQSEFMDVISYYNMQSEGLGYEFAAEVRRTIERIIQYPEAWFKLSKRTHRCRTNRYSYGVIYQVRDFTHCGSNASESRTSNLEISVDK